MNGTKSPKEKDTEIMKKYSKLMMLCALCALMMIVAAGCGGASDSDDTEKFSFDQGITVNEELFGGVSAAVVVTNDSDRAAVSTEVVFTFYDADGNVMQYGPDDQAYYDIGARGDMVMHCDVGTLMPGQSTAISFGADLMNISKLPDHIEFGISDVKWKDAEDVKNVPVSVGEHSMDIKEGELNVQVVNDSDVNYPDDEGSGELIYVIVARDKDGKILGGTSATAEDVPAHSEKTDEVFFSGDEIEALGAASYDIYTQTIVPAS